MRGLWLLAVLAAFFVGGCGERHLHPETGKSYKAVFKAQRKAKPKRALMSGEDAVIVMHNMEKGAKQSDLKGGGGAGALLPIQR